jgi:hypothetical protein
MLLAVLSSESLSHQFLDFSLAGIVDHEQLKGYILLI